MAWLHASGFGGPLDTAILDQPTSDFGGDAAVARAIVDHAPSIAAFYLEPYNLDRSQWIVKRLRTVLPSTHFAAWGPETSGASPELRHAGFDILIDGDPEPAFKEILADIKQGAIKPLYSGWGLIDPSAVRDPYLDGILAMGPDKPVLVATILDRLPSTAEGWIRTELAEWRQVAAGQAARIIRKAAQADVRDAVLIDTSLDARNDLEGFIKSLAAANDSGVGIHLRLNPAAIDDELAKLLADASAASVKVSLPVVNSRSLTAMGLSLDKDIFERGCQLIATSGAAVLPESILGLPYDSYETVIDTFDYLAMIGLGQDTELRPLTLMPGSQLRQAPKVHGIQEFLEKPPYSVLETSWMSEDDMLDAVADFEESFDVAWSRTISPTLRPLRGGFLTFVDSRDPGSLDALLLTPERLASSVTILMDGNDPERMARIARAAKDIRKDNPFCLWQIVIYSDSGIPDAGMVARLSDAFMMTEHYFELIHLFTMDPQPSFQVRIFFATTSETLALRTLKEHQQLETLFILGDRLPSPRLQEALPFLCFDRETTPFELLYDVMNAYRNYPDLLVDGPRDLFRPG